MLCPCIWAEHFCCPITEKRRVSAESSAFRCFAYKVWQTSANGTSFFKAVHACSAAARVGNNPNTAAPLPVITLQSASCSSILFRIAATSSRSTASSNRLPQSGAISSAVAPFRNACRKSTNLCRKRGTWGTQRNASGTEGAGGRRSSWISECW